MKKVILILIINLFALNLLFAQKVESNSSNKDAENPKFKISPIFPVNVATTYQVTESSEIKRIFKDSTSNSYTRDIDYFITVVASSLPKDFQQIVTVSIDSIRFKFNDGLIKADYNSQTDDATPPFNIMDFEAHNVPVGKEYDLTYNPYNEVYKISGNRYQELMDRWHDPDEHYLPKNPFKRFVYERGVSLEELSFIGDIHKSLLPKFRVQIDTFWTSNPKIVIDGIDIQDSVLMKFVSFDTKLFKLEGSANNIRVNPTKARIHGVNELVEVLGGKGKTHYKINVTPQGAIDNLEILCDLDIKCKINNDEFNQNYKTKFNWKKLKSFRW